jgi:hypothetical protein
MFRFVIFQSQQVGLKVLVQVRGGLHMKQFGIFKSVLRIWIQIWIHANFGGSGSGSRTQDLNGQNWKNVKMENIVIILKCIVVHFFLDFINFH